MKNIQLESLDLEVSVWDNFYYFFDGFVENISEYEYILSLKYETKYENVNPDRYSGRYIIREKDNSDKVNFHIYLLKDLPLELSVFNKGANETYLLYELGLEERLMDSMEKYGIATDILYDYEIDVLAAVGGFFAMEKNILGYKHDLFVDFKISYFKQALLLYNSCKNKN